MKKIVLTLIFCLLPLTAYCVNYNNDANCMGSWGMESANSETDLSGEGGTLTESTDDDIPISATKMFGDYSRDFEATDTEYLTHADNLSTDINGADQKISIMGWVNPESGGDYKPIITKYGSTGQRQYAIVKESSGDRLQFSLSSDGTALASAIGATDTDNSLGSWYHYVGVYNDTDIRVYVNGSLDSNGASNPLTYSNGIKNSTAAFIIGTRVSLDLWFDGLIDDVGIFNRELTSAEVSDIYTNGMAGAAVTARRIIMIY